MACCLEQTLIGAQIRKHNSPLMMLSLGMGEGMVACMPASCHFGVGQKCQQVGLLMKLSTLHQPWRSDSERRYRKINPRKEFILIWAELVQYPLQALLPLGTPSSLLVLREQECLCLSKRKLLEHLTEAANTERLRGNSSQRKLPRWKSQRVIHGNFITSCLFPLESLSFLPPICLIHLGLLLGAGGKAGSLP